MLKGELVEQKVFVFSDASHALKNIRNAWSSYRFILSPRVVEKEKLVSPIVDLDHVRQLFNFQKDKELKYNPGLDVDCFPSPTDNLLKMKVGPAKRLCSKATADGLRMLVKNHGYPPSFNTTAYFLEMLGTWVDMMLSRSRSQSFSLKNEDKFKEMIEFFEEFNRLFDELRFECKSGNVHKPIQKCVWLSSTSMVAAAKYFLYERKWDFLLGGRFTSDAIENFFSQVRRKNPNPTPMEFQWRFRALLLLQHMKSSKYQSYQEDDTDCKWLTELKDIKELQLLKEEEEDKDDNDLCDHVVQERVYADFAEQNSLTYGIGYILLKTIFSKSKCVTCQKAFAMETSDGSEWLKLIEEKCYVPNALTIPSEMAYSLFSVCETTFRDTRSNALLIKDFDSMLVDKMYDTLVGDQFPFDVPTCHLKLLLERFFTIRLHWWSKFLTRKAQGTDEFIAKKKAAGYASKSVQGSQLT